MSRMSFVVPAFNAEATIGQTLASVAAQTTPCEVIVIDDGSTDETASAAGEFDVRLVRQENAGLAAARNRGLRACTGECVCFLDADDVVHADYATCMLRAIEGFDLASCGHAMAGPDLEDLGWTTAPGAADGTVERMLGVNPFVVGAVTLRRDAIDRFGVEGPFDATLPVHEDWDLWLRLTSAGATWAAPVQEALFTYRLRHGSMSTDLDLMWRTGLRVIGKAGASVPAQARARRCWTVRSLARAIARRDRVLAAGLVQFLDGVSDDDIGLLASSLRWALQREDIVGPGAVGLKVEAWQGRVRETVDAALARRVLERLDLRARDWAAMARTLLARLAAHERIVLYGMGRNGRRLQAAIAEAGGSVAGYIDDDPGVVVENAVRVDALHRGDVVVVTPDDAKGAIDRLQAHDRVLTLGDLAPSRASA